MKTNYLDIDNVEFVCEEMLFEIAAFHRIKPIQALKHNSALIVIDMQKYFADSSSNAYIPSMEAIIQNINSIIELFHNNNMPIIYTKHHNIENSDNSMLRFWNGSLDKKLQCFEFVDGLKTVDSATIIEKETYDAFYESDLEQLLKSMNVKHIVICGVFAHLCVETTARAAFVRNYDVSLLIDAIASYNFEYHFATALNLSHGVASIGLSNQIEIENNAQ